MLNVICFVLLLLLMLILCMYRCVYSPLQFPLALYGSKKRKEKKENIHGKQVNFIVFTL